MNSYGKLYAVVQRIKDPDSALESSGQPNANHADFLHIICTVPESPLLSLLARRQVLL